MITNSHTETDIVRNSSTSPVNKKCSMTNELTEKIKSPQMKYINEGKINILNEKYEKDTNESINIKEYEPYDYCTSGKPTNYSDTLFHLLKFFVGTGIFALPSAFKDVGYIIGIVGIIFVTSMYAYCIHLLFKTEYVLCKRRQIPNLSYANTVHAAFEEVFPKYRWLATSGKFFTNSFFVIYESGGCAVYVIFISSNLKQLLDYYLNDDLNLQLIMLYVTLPMILNCWIRNLKLLSPLSATANFILVLCFILVFWYEFQVIPTFEGKEAFADFSKIPAYLNTILFATSCTGIILPLKSEMRHPAKFISPTGVLNVAFIPVSLLYAAFGFFGYLKYGNDVAESITLNLPKNELPAQVIRGLSLLPVFISYHLCYYVVLDIVWKHYLKNKSKKKDFIREYAFRTLFPIIIFIMAYAIPNLKTFISLVGAFGICATSLIIPIVVHTLVFWNMYQTKAKFYVFFFKNIILFSVAMIIFVSGILESIVGVFELYHK
ncbi:hypothetical protein PGB90_009792 [Kerria lacca]